MQLLVSSGTQLLPVLAAHLGLQQRPRGAQSYWELTFRGWDPFLLACLLPSVCHDLSNGGCKQRQEEAENSAEIQGASCQLFPWGGITGGPSPTTHPSLWFLCVTELDTRADSQVSWLSVAPTRRSLLQRICYTQNGGPRHTALLYRHNFQQ